MEQTKEKGGCKPEIIKNRGRLNMESRRQGAYKALDYNILRRTENEKIQTATEDIRSLNVRRKQEAFIFD